jgi:hypothetical protein
MALNFEPELAKGNISWSGHCRLLVHGPAMVDVLVIGNTYVVDSVEVLKLDLVDGDIGRFV